jgi:hypothetical protein
MEIGFTDESGVALAEALTANETLHKMTLSGYPVFTGEPLANTDELGAPPMRHLLQCCAVIQASSWSFLRLTIPVVTEGFLSLKTRWLSSND